MFTDQMLDGSMLALVALALLVYWRLLGSRVDARLFLALNFSLISVWAIVSSSTLMLRAAAVLFILALVAGYRASRPRPLSARLDRWLEADLSVMLLAISFISIVVNLHSAALTLADKANVLEQQAQNPVTRYVGYLLLTGSWLSVHVICRASAQIRWSRMQLLALAAAVLASVTSLSKASFLPTLLALLFAYAPRIGRFRLILLLTLGTGVTLLLIRRLFGDLPLALVAELFFARIIKNVDVLDYIEALGPNTPFQYPHASVFYPLWPFFQLTQQRFIVLGVWLHGTLFNDWRGFGPNPTFVGDLLIASRYLGLLLAPLFGRVLRAADRSSYRVFLAMVCYEFLQDWYLTCLTLSLFVIVFLVSKGVGRVWHFISRIFTQTNVHRHSHTTLSPRG